MKETVKQFLHQNKNMLVEIGPNLAGVIEAILGFCAFILFVIIV